MPKKPDAIVNIRLRLPAALHSTLTKEAEAARRSLNSEILWRLSETLGDAWKAFVAEIERKERADQEFLKQTRERLAADPVLKAKYDEIIDTIKLKDGRTIGEARKGKK
jgi:hypothetical protein